MTKDLDFWKESIDAYERDRLAKTLERSFEQDGRLRGEMLEEKNWAVVLFVNSIWGAPMDRLWRACSGEMPELLVADMAQEPEPDYFRVRQSEMAYYSAGSVGGISGALIVESSMDFLFLGYDTWHAGHFWIFAGDRKCAEAVAGCSLETRWLQFRAYADWGERSESLSEEMYDLLDWYRPFNGLEEEPSPEPVRAKMAAELESCRPSSHTRRVVRWWNAQTWAERMEGPESDWIGCPVGSSNFENDSYILEWADSADRLAEAAGRLGVEGACAVVVADERRGIGEAYRFEMTRDSLLQFEARCQTRDFLLVPPGREFLIFRSSAGYYLYIGPADFVLSAVGCRSMDINLIAFESWKKRFDSWKKHHPQETNLEGQVEEKEEEVAGVVDACETRWLEYLEEYGSQGEVD